MNNKKTKAYFDSLLVPLSDVESEKATGIIFEVNTTKSGDMSFYAENICEILEDDPDWNPLFSGQAIYRQNMGRAKEGETIVIDGEEIEVDTSYVGDKRHTIYLYIPFGVDYEYKEGLATAAFSRKFNQTLEIFPVEECVTFKEITNVPVCKHLIVNKNSNDAVLEFYDYPFTILPLENSCSSTDLGHSAKAVGACTYASRGTFTTCSSYEPFEPVELGTLDNKALMLTRSFVGYENVHEYQCEDLIFESFADLQKHAAEENLTLDITWSPLAKPVPFFETVIGRLEVTYPREKV